VLVTCINSCHFSVVYFVLEDSGNCEFSTVNALSPLLHRFEPMSQVRYIRRSLPSLIPDHFMHNALKISPPSSSLLFFSSRDVIFHQFFSCPATGNDLSLCISVMAGGDNDTVGNIRHGSMGVRHVKVQQDP